MQKIDLIVIDPQDDFCNPSGALFVKGADEDMKRVTTMVKRIGQKLNDIHVTLDSHHLMDIAHPMFWKDSAGNHPPIFTIITANDVKQGKWTPTQLGKKDAKTTVAEYAINYTQTLEKNGRYPLCIWPPHCLIGSKGHAIVPELFDALRTWEEQNTAFVDFVTKGSNLWTEHYSAVQADVPDPADPSTQVNTKFITTLINVDVIAVAGEASSHCVSNTMRDVIRNFGDPAYAKKIVILTDGMSAVPGFEKFQDDFYKEMAGLGVKTSTTVDFLA